ncbi:MAG: hypothetical protein ACI9FB_000846 [Candidatus Azotimanducaceae bacterium]|jgi:hypothetical protein
MDVKLLARGSIIFFVLFISFGTNLEDNFISRIGLDSNYGYVIFAAMLITLFVTNRHGLMIAAILIFSLNANMPIDFELNLGFDRDYYTGLMVALILQPLTTRIFF